MITQSRQAPLIQMKMALGLDPWSLQNPQSTNEALCVLAWTINLSTVIVSAST